MSKTSLLVVSVPHLPVTSGIQCILDRLNQMRSGALRYHLIRQRLVLKPNVLNFASSSLLYHLYDLTTGEILRTIENVFLLVVL